jgi:hypothetical protein
VSARQHRVGLGQRFGLGLGLVLLMVSPGCKRPAATGAGRDGGAVAAPLAVVGLEVEDRTPLGERPRQAPAGEQLRQLVIGRIARKVPVADEVKQGRSLPASQRGYRLTVVMGLEQVEVEARGVARVEMGARLEEVGAPPGEAPPALESRGKVEKLYDVPAVKAPGALAALWRAHLERACDNVVGDVLGQARMRTAPVPELLALLKGKDADLKLAAVRALGPRRAPESLAPLGALLADPDEEMRDAAIGALLATGDPRAVPFLTRSTTFSDTVQLRKVMFAVGELGGPEAVAFLQLIASGHDDEEIKALARRMADKLAGQDKAPATDGGPSAD